MGRHGFPGIFPAKVWLAAAFIVAMVLRESLVRNHEPCAKALGNYVIRMGLGEREFFFNAYCMSVRTRYSGSTRS